jgi:mannosidase alpha-like ER degradation enhancer 2
MGDHVEFVKGVEYIIKSIDFNKDVNVSVFETNIRVLGGLLSAHLLAQNQTIMPHYKNELLPMIVDLANRLLLAFDTPTGIPYGTVNLRHGVPPGEVQITCVAAAGTHLLEFGMVSHLTGDPKFYYAAKKAIYGLYDRKSSLGLVGNHIHIYNGQWTLKESGIGAGIDSYFEYLFKGYLLFGEEEYLYLFDEFYYSIQKYLYKKPWYVDVDMSTGNTVWPVFNSLQAFWPGLISMAGHVSEAKETLASMHSVWRKFGLIPEGFNFQLGAIQNGQQGYPLRPELAESIYHLYRATRDPIYLFMGRDIVYSLNNITRVKCGFANVANVADRTLTDRMESFFLAETIKYLYLLFDDENFVNQNPYTFNTEGHLIPLRKEYLRTNSTMNVSLGQCKVQNDDNFFSIE